MQSAQAAANDSGWGISASAGSGDVDDGEVGGDRGDYESGDTTKDYGDYDGGGSSGGDGGSGGGGDGWDGDGDSGECRVNYGDGGGSGGGGDINRLDGVSAGDDGAAGTKTYSRYDSGPVEAI